jgi:selenocysteine lyase/cysteine desulfurase
VVYPDLSGKIRAEAIINAIRKNTRMVIVNHISNVTGAKAPIEEIGEYTKRAGILLLVDAAQSAGHTKIDMQNTGINILAAAGHKGLAAPQGVGILALEKGINLQPIILGGTGTQSESPIQPDDLPESLESGTVSTPAIAGLNAGMSWIKEHFDDINYNIYNMTQYLYEEMIKIPQVIVYTPKGEFNGLVTFNINGLTSGETANLLNEKFDIYVRSGLHCAPLAHKFLGTQKHGAVRASLSYQNTFEEVLTFLRAIREILKNI